MLSFWKRTRPRVQFGLKTLLVTMACAASFFAGMAYQKQLDKPIIISTPAKMTPGAVYTETVEFGGHKWHRLLQADQ